MTERSLLESSPDPLASDASPADRTDIAVIVVNYGTADLAVKAVDSVLELDCAPYRVALHLVDNGSPDSSEALRLKEAAGHPLWQDRVTLYLESENHGFGGGNNLVLKRLAGRAQPPRYVFLLNPDAVVQPGTLDKLISFMEAHPSASIAGAGIIRSGTNAKVVASFRFPTLATEVFSGAPLSILSRVFKIHGVAMPVDTPECPVDWVSGAGFIARFKDLEDIGFFDPAFFLYFEETDLMKRIDGDVFFVPSAQIVHIAGAATGLIGGQHRNGRTPQFWYESWRIYFDKHFGRLGALGIALARLTAYSVYFSAKLLSGSPSVQPHRFGRDFFAQVLIPLLTKRKL
ncbi:MAG: glycosyltransferase family 2 protein [Pseudomonadota bacterium]